MEDKRVSFLDCGIAHITLNEWQYQLDVTKPVGRGGTCLVYHALRQETGNPRRVIIKELYPVSQGSSVRKPDGFLELPDSLSLRKCQDRFTHSYEMFKQLFNTDELNHYTVQAQEKPRGYGTTYMVVDYSSGITLEDYIEQAPSLFDFFTQMKVLAVVLDRMHKQGMVHMDLKPSNILCFDDGPVKYCKLMDTDSFLRKDASTEELSMSISEGYVAPEIYRIACLMQDPFGNSPQLERESACFSLAGEKADVFSFGVILFRYLFGTLPYLPLNGRRVWKQIWQNQLDELLKDLPKLLKEKDFTITPMAILRIRKLLQGMLAGVPDDRLSASQIENLISKILPLLDPKETRIVENFCPNPYPVVGRDEKLDAIKEALYQQETKSRIVLVTGLGGIGKSTLARHYAQIHRKAYDIITEISASSAEKAVMFIPIQAWDADKLERTNWEPGAKDSLSRRIELLATLNSKFRTLLIVNNYDVSEDENFEIWYSLNCDVILTSRNDWSQSGKMCVSLTCGDLAPRSGQHPAKEIFRFFFLEQAGSEPRRKQLNSYLEEESSELDQLLVRMNYHPLGLKLLARHMTTVPGEEMLPSQVLMDFNREVFDQNAPEEFINDRDTTPLERNFYGHLAYLFRAALKNSQLTDSDIDALRYMTLISPDYGISTKRFHEWTGMKPVYLSRLKRRGWVEYLPQQQDYLTKSDFGVYIMPTIIQEVLWKEPMLKSTSQNCGLFLKQCSIHYSEFPFFSKIQSRLAFYAQQDILVQKLPCEKSVEYICLLQNTVAFTRLSDDPDADLDVAADRWKQCIDLASDFSAKPTLLGRCYNEISRVYTMLGETGEAYRYCIQNWQELKKHTIHDDDTSEWLVEWLEAIIPLQVPEMRANVMLELLEQCRGKLPKEAPNHLLLYGMFELLTGEHFMSIGRLDTARLHMQKALTYFQQETTDIGNANRGNMRTCQMLGDLCLQQRDLEAAQKYLMRSLDVNLNIIGEDHVQTGYVLLSIASTYVFKNNIPAAFDYHMRVKNILERIDKFPDFMKVDILLEIFLDVWSDSTLEDYVEVAQDCFEEAVTILNQIQEYVTVTDLGSAASAMDYLAIEQMELGLTSLKLQYMEIYGVLCYRLFSLVSSPSEAYRRIAEIYDHFGFYTTAKRYLNYAQNEE